MTFGSSILMFDHISLNAGSVDTQTFNTGRIAELSEYFRIVFKADAYNDALGYDGMYEPKIKIRVAASCASGDTYEYLLFPIDLDGRGFYQDIRLRSGAYNTFTFSIINDSSSTLDVSQVEFCPESREEDITKIMDSVVNLDKTYYGVSVSNTNGLTIERSDGHNTDASVTLNANELAFQAKENGIMHNRLYFDPVSRKYIFDGTIIIRDGSVEFINGASFTQVRYSTNPQATIPSGWSITWNSDWDDGETRVWAIYSYNGGTTWTSPAMIQGADGDAGESPITISLFSTAGTVISQGVTSTRIYAVVMQGGVNITSDISYLRFSWHKYFKDGTEDLNWHPTYTYEGRRDSINVSEADIASTATFTCLIEEES